MLAEHQNEEPASRGQISRRTLLAASGGLSAVALMTFASLGSAPAFAAAAPTSAAGVVALGRTYLGMGLANIRPLTDSPWSSYPNDNWCAWFISWIIRGLGYGAINDAGVIFNKFPAVTDVQSVRVGDLTRINGQPPFHIGIVSSVSNGLVILDGNRTGGNRGTPPMGTKVIEAGGYTAGTIFSRPNYSDFEVDAMAQPITTRIIRNTSTGHIVLLHPAGVANFGDPLLPNDAPSYGNTNWQAKAAGQPLGSDGFYWINLPNNDFSWEIARHNALLAAMDAHMKAIVEDALN